MAKRKMMCGEELEAKKAQFIKQAKDLFESAPNPEVAKARVGALADELMVGYGLQPYNPAKFPNNPFVSEAGVKETLQTHWAELAVPVLLTIQAFQTPHEESIGTTTVDNGVGLGGSCAERLKPFLPRLEAGGTLTQDELAQFLDQPTGKRPKYIDQVKKLLVAHAITTHPDVIETTAQWECFYRGDFGLWK